MTTPENIRAVEALLAAHRISVSELCRRAGVHVTTWHRWKHDGVSPALRTWKRVEREVAKLNRPKRPRG